MNQNPNLKLLKIILAILRTLISQISTILLNTPKNKKTYRIKIS